MCPDYLVGPFTLLASLNMLLISADIEWINMPYDLNVASLPHLGHGTEIQVDMHICYYSLYLRRVRQLIVRFYEEEIPEFDMKHVTIDAVYVFTLNEEPHWRVYANVVYPL